jgi:hypothetical protein
MHGFPWDRKTAFHLWTYRDIFYVLPKGIGEKPIQLMAAVITDILAEETGTDS